MSKTYTIATLNDLVIATVPDEGNIYAAVADEAERAGIEGVILTDEEEEGDEIVFRAGPHTGYLMDEEGRRYNLAVIRKV